MPKARSGLSRWRVPRRSRPAGRGHGPAPGEMLHNQAGEPQRHSGRTQPRPVFQPRSAPAQVRGAVKDCLAHLPKQIAPSQQSTRDGCANEDLPSGSVLLRFQEKTSTPSVVKPLPNSAPPAINRLTCGLIHCARGSVPGSAVASLLSCSRWRNSTMTSSESRNTNLTEATNESNYAPSPRLFNYSIPMSTSGGTVSGESGTWSAKSRIGYLERAVEPL